MRRIGSGYARLLEGRVSCTANKMSFDSPGTGAPKLLEGSLSSGRQQKLSATGELLIPDILRPYLFEKLLLGPDRPNFAQMLIKKKRSRDT